MVWRKLVGIIIVENVNLLVEYMLRNPFLARRGVQHVCSTYDFM